jgi:hypothetical protein
LNREVGTRARLASFVLPPRPMRYRRIALMIALYVTFDLTNPFVGRAFNFNADETMDGVTCPHEPLFHQAGMVPLPMPSGRDEAGLARPAPARAFPSRAIGEWFVQLRQAHAPQSEPQSPTEDH